ncbi:hypothetical protein BX661DRAFT_189323 [Kickxella alabastrina]|uniref:uncharacterized protein n=1 Tax=Kickxella alabastrina TaxID=61397 RepID=UPI00221EDBA1|nr:uncharacterized protein BX661DRAFT_189652 [Kickxella alabastrina]XP_051388707.1 uncharacterized protein BX661DRAFT_189323 [Kickxella alabastrina]KAI7819884.1 hypothetical protein BX661DRAFT_189652 [Kickxella alabastrina]KAI7820363.1 hypothetical protein BX661DRAFT_189323 [Kickxella alabastrina]
MVGLIGCCEIITKTLIFFEWLFFFCRGKKIRNDLVDPDAGWPSLQCLPLCFSKLFLVYPTLVSLLFYCLALADRHFLFLLWILYLQ